MASVSGRCLIGLDFGSASARGVLLDADTGARLGAHRCDYRHGTLTTALPTGRPLPSGWALQVAPDYEEAAEAILSALGRGRDVAGIGVGFTASSPLPTLSDGTPLSGLRPDDPHAYVKLYRHAAQSQAERLSASGTAHLGNFGGRLSGEWLLPKALQVSEEAPDTWAATERFIEAGDWLVWRLTGREARSQGLAAFKAQWTEAGGYPDLVPDLAARLAAPLAIGSAAGPLSATWRARTGIAGDALVAVAVIDSHVVLPAVGATEDGTFTGALGTSAAYVHLAAQRRPLPAQAEGMTWGGALPGLWAAESGQASFGATLAWWASLTAPGEPLGHSLARLDASAAALPPGAGGIALDWWSGRRVPDPDARLSGLLVGLRADATGPAIHRALAEGLAFGARAILDGFREGGLPLRRVVMTSGLAGRSPFLVQLMADVLERRVEVPLLEDATAVGAAIHGAVAAGVVASFAEGAARLGAREARTFEPREALAEPFRRLYEERRSLAADDGVQQAMRTLAALAETRRAP